MRVRQEGDRDKATNDNKMATKSSRVRRRKVCDLVREDEHIVKEVKLNIGKQMEVEPSAKPAGRKDTTQCLALDDKVADKVTWKPRSVSRNCLKFHNLMKSFLFG